MNEQHLLTGAEREAIKARNEERGRRGDCICPECDAIAEAKDDIDALLELIDYMEDIACHP